jgi:uncharacterized protein (DUF2141 family)
MKQRMDRRASLPLIPAVVLMVLSILGLTPQLIAEDAAISTLTIHVVGAKNSEGQIAIALSHGEPGFPRDKSKAVRTLQTKVDPQILSAQVT